jgi:hypothetical protein
VRRTLPGGGKGVIRLNRPRRFSRITAVLANADIDVSSLRGAQLDWIYSDDRARFDSGVFAIRRSRREAG